MTRARNFLNDGPFDDWEGGRPGWGEFFLGVAYAFSRRGDCTRRQVGAVIVDADHLVIGTGYNGSPPGGPSCLAGECPRGRHYKRHRPRTAFDLAEERTSTKIYICACGNGLPCPDDVPPGSDYSNCVARDGHAERNALRRALLVRPAPLDGCTIYVTTEVCPDCRELIAAAGIENIIEG